jgi:hypothetical protein
MSIAKMFPMPPHLQHIVDAKFPRFSEAEMSRRRLAMHAAIDKTGVDIWS